MVTKTKRKHDPDPSDDDESSDSGVSDVEDGANSGETDEDESSQDDGGMSDVKGGDEEDGTDADDEGGDDEGGEDDDSDDDGEDIDTGVMDQPLKKKQMLNVARQADNTVVQPRRVRGEKCRACKDKKSSDATAAADVARFFRTLLETIAPGIALGAKQLKYPAVTHQELLLKKHPQKKVRTELAYTDYTQEPELQYLRWVSSMAYGYLLKNKQKPIEIQVLWDGFKLYISANKPGATQFLEDHDDAWKKSTNVKTRNIYFNARYVRHALKLKGIAASSTGLKIPLDKHDVKYVKDGIAGEKHAEIRLVEYWEKKKFFRPKNAKKNIYVAGIKRPCLACFSRLQELKETLKKQNINLVHKQRPGLFWPSQSALRDLSAAERTRLEDNLCTYIALYTTHNDIYLDSESETEAVIASRLEKLPPPPSKPAKKGAAAHKKKKKRSR